MKQIWLIILALLFSSILAYDSTLLKTCSGSCTSGCASCKNSTCASCQTGYTLNSSANTCQPNSCIIPNCSACDSTGACVKCSDSYSVYDSFTSRCVQKCTLSNCAKCVAGSSACVLCNPGYTLYSQTRQCVSRVISNCLIMHDFRTQQFQCTLCDSGSQPSIDQTECISGSCSYIADCESCADNSTCSQCRIGYSFSSGTCSPNSCNVSNCLYCNSFGLCQRCKSSFTLSSNQCSLKSCSLANCDSCKPGSIFCDSCQQGYSNNIWTNNCDGSNPKLKYLWFLWLLLIPIAVVIVVCIVKKRKALANDSNTNVYNGSINDLSKIENKEVLEVRHDQSFVQAAPSSQVVLSPTKQADQVKGLS